jgi:hypothetical protein
MDRPRPENEPLLNMKFFRNFEQMYSQKQFLFSLGLSIFVKKQN